MSGASEVPAARDGAGDALVIEDLEVSFGSARPAVGGVTIRVRPGEIVAVVGESGSGKTMTAMAALGLLPPLARWAGRVEVAGLDLRSLGRDELRSVRGRDIAMVFQEPMTALNPVFTVGWQVAEALQVHDQGRSRPQALRRAAELLRLAGISDPERRLGQYPHELSGGLRQRVMIAMAIACDPKVLVADEATTALDVTVQAEILDLLRRIRSELGTAILVITHNMGVVADIADRVVVMHDGVIVEEAAVDDLFGRPAAEYTQSLLASVPRLAPHPRGARLRDEPGTGGESAGGESAGGEWADGEPPGGGRAGSAGAPVLALDHLTLDFGSRASGTLRAVDDVSLAIAPGEILGLVGESGSGKSTVGRCAIGLLRPTSGAVRLLGEDLAASRGRRLQGLRRRCGIVFQDPGSSLDPRMTIEECVAEPLVIAGTGRAGRAGRVAELLASVRLDPAVRSRYPHELSGGQRQRVSIARAIALRPELLVADEPTSALDVSVQATVLDLLLDLQAELGFACLFITHDLAVVSFLADRIAVMRSGRLVELGPRDDVLFAPRHAYTQRLVAAAPVPDPAEQRQRRLARLSLAPERSLEAGLSSEPGLSTGGPAA
jgi:peptide/nickel transport system ATP-binding protein